MPRKPGAHSQGVRLIRLLRRLQGRRQGAPLADLEHEFGIGRAQLRRDLAALEEAGLRLANEQEEGRHGRTRVRLIDADIAVTLDQTERYTLTAIRGVFNVFRGTPFHEAVESIFDKLAGPLPAEARKGIRALAERIVYLPSGGTKSYEGKQDILDDLLNGVLLRRLVKFTYVQRSGRRSSGTLAPYALAIYRNGLYVVGSRLEEDGRFQPPRTFAVERFAELAWVRRSSFEIPDGFRVEDYFDGAFGLITGHRRHHIIVDFDKSARVEVLRRQWHRTQRCTELPHGGVRVEFDLSSLREVVSWVLEWGPQIRVIEPAALRREVVDRLRATLALYE